MWAEPWYPDAPDHADHEPALSEAGDDVPREVWEALCAELGDVAGAPGWVPPGEDPARLVAGVRLPWWVADGRLDEASPEQAVGFLAAVEKAKARLDGLTVAVTRALVTCVDADLAKEKARLPHRLRCTVEQAHSVVAMEVQLATGLGKGDCGARVEFVTAPTARTAALEEALNAGAMSWPRAKTVFTECERVRDDRVANEIAATVLAPPRRGEAPVSWAQFRRRLTNALWPHTDTAAERAKNLAGRRVESSGGPGGVGFVTITGSNERVAGAAERVEALARAAAPTATPAPWTSCAPTSPST